MADRMELWIDGRGIYPVHSLEHASALYGSMRDDSGEGCSTFPFGRVFLGDDEVARVSYNGRVWMPEPWHPGARPLLEAVRFEEIAA